MMRRFLCSAVLWLLPLLPPAAPANAQETPADKVSVSFSDSSRPGSLRVSIMTGGIIVTGHEGKEVVVEARARHGGQSHPERSGERTDGLTRLANPNTGLTVEEENNVMSVKTSGSGRPVDLHIQVPIRTSLNLNSINDGDIKVDRVQGEIEVNNINGGVMLANISGSAVAHALNGNVIVTFDSVAQGKSMSFSSMNGNIDVTFPADLKANVVMKSEQGEIYSDFDIQMDPAARQPVVEDARAKGGKYRIRLDKSLYGKISGGGPEMQFKNFNGDIYIRKKK